MKIQGVYDLAIYVDELDLFQAPNTIFMGADLYESIMNPIPTCRMELIIPIQWLDKRTLVDGTKLTFEIKSKEFEINERYTYRVFNLNKISLDQQQAHVILDGVLDFFEGYTNGNALNGYYSSSDLFHKIADKYNLRYDIDRTNDRQLWVAGQKNIYQFMVDTAKYGWINETSGMFWCFDRQKRLLYKNLTSLFRERQENVYKFVQKRTGNKENKEYAYTRITASIQAGSNNLKNAGYGGADYCFDTNLYILKSIAARKVVAESKLININKELSKGLYEEFYPFDVGNFHPNYYLALKQNKRILSTYSTYMILDCQYLQNYRLGQIVSLDYMDSQTSKNQAKSMSGIYMIDAIHCIISKESLTGTAELVAQGMNGIASTQEVY